MKILVTFGLMISLSVLAQQRLTLQDYQQLRKQKDREAALAIQQQEAIRKLASHVEVRRVNGTNYNVGYLKAWLAHINNTPRPLPDWKEINGRVLRVRDDGALIREELIKRRYEIVRKERRDMTKGERLTQAGLYLTGAPPPMPPERRLVEEKTEEGALMLLKHCPLKLSSAQKFNGLAMFVSQDRNTEGDWVFTYDYGEPVDPPKK
ncbi:MAG: hypothetical protein DME23_13195 [Verrucomicrobia bacterium]|nr:MAG: hypothetical protein DME23_13195 [Verrucomicrobiota bacterium]